MEVTEKRGRTPLHYAVVNEYKELVQLLLSRAADKHKCDKDGRSPIDFAADDEIRKLLEGRYCD
jgi:ankyrin repeat protein